MSSTLGRILYRRVVGASSVLSSGFSVGSSSGSTPAATDSDHLSESSESTTCGSTLTEIKGIIFDMDGTLTIPMLRFNEMRVRLGLTPAQDILPTVQSFSPDKKAAAMAIIEEMEEECAKMMQLQPGVLDLLHYIAERGVKRALMTRNSTKSAMIFVNRLQEMLVESQDKYPHLQPESLFSEVITRDFVPCKPDPSAALHICKQWGVEPRQVAIVGDDKTDMICGIRAGTAFNILLRNKRNDEQVDYSNFKVEMLSDIIRLFSLPLEVSPKTEDT